LGLGADICIITALVVSFARVCNWSFVPVHVMQLLRDGFGETEMMGFFSDYRDLGRIDTGAEYSTVMSVAFEIAAKIKARKFKAPEK
jgi:hypothetical protein